MDHPHSVQAAASMLQIPADELAEALERARVVGVLDAWAAEVNGRVWMVSQHEGPLPTWCCKLGGLRWYNQETPDAARAAAAKAIEKGGV